MSTNVKLLKGKNIIEIGCGHALPGIYCLMNGAANVDFQDFNEEVLTHLTIPNILLNVKNINSKFYSGDWESLVVHI